MGKKLTRRKFVKTAAAASATAVVVPHLSFRDSSSYDSKQLPTRKLGKTGIEVPLIIIGKRKNAFEEIHRIAHSVRKNNLGTINQKRKNRSL